MLDEDSTLPCSSCYRWESIWLLTVTWKHSISSWLSTGWWSPRSMLWLWPSACTRSTNTFFEGWFNSLEALLSAPLYASYLGRSSTDSIWLPNVILRIFVGSSGYYALNFYNRGTACESSFAMRFRSSSGTISGFSTASFKNESCFGTT